MFPDGMGAVVLLLAHDAAFDALNDSPRSSSELQSGCKAHQRRMGCLQSMAFPRDMSATVWNGQELISSSTAHSNAVQRPHRQACILMRRRHDSLARSLQSNLRHACASVTPAHPVQGLLDQKARQPAGAKPDMVAVLARIPRNLRGMYVHAYQSWLWNAAASARVAAHGLAQPVAGDLVLPVHASGSDDAAGAADAGMQAGEDFGSGVAPARWAPARWASALPNGIAWDGIRLSVQSGAHSVRMELPELACARLQQAVPGGMAGRPKT